VGRGHPPLGAFDASTRLAPSALNLAAQLQLLDPPMRSAESSSCFRAQNSQLHICGLRTRPSADADPQDFFADTD